MNNSRLKLASISVLAFTATFMIGSISADAAIVADLTGMRSTASGGGLTANGNQAGGGFKILWTITFDDETDLYHYKYEIQRESGSSVAISHFNLEVSSFFTSDDLIDPNPSNVTAPGEIKVSTGNSNRGMPSDMGSGIKFDTESAVYEFDSPKIPVWGDIFGKKGNGGFFNDGFGTDPINTDSPFINWVATPDTDTSSLILAPLPAATWTAIPLLAVIGIIKRSSNR